MFRCHLSHMKEHISQNYASMCVREREREKPLYTGSISSILIMWCVYLEAGRRSAMRFVDVHGYKLPSPGGVFVEHLWHKDKHMRGRTHKENPAHHSNYWTKLKHTHTDIYPLATSS